MSDPELLLGQARRRGLRITEQRAIILRALCELDGHASVERVHSRVAREHPGVARSTVYRTLEKLRDLRILSQTDLGRGCDEYEMVTDQPHHHLVCQGCGRVADLDHGYFAFVGDAVRRDFAFEAVLDHLAIFGLCRECQEGRRHPG
jgi:Fur family ferric uptake transcriptional regulator